MNYYLPKNYKSKRVNDAGSKARMDVERILDGLGFQALGKRGAVSKSRVRHFVVTLANVVRMFRHVREGDVLVLQYPVKYYQAICRLARWRRAHVVTLIHDLGCFRQKHNSVEKEIRLMNLSDALIALNPVMCRWLLDNGLFQGGEGQPKKYVVPLELWDFLSESQSPERKADWPLHKIVYAGQLSYRKNSFLYEVGACMEHYTANVYGKGFDKSRVACPEKFEAKGFMAFDTLIGEAEGDFGLVWDGDSVDCCRGDWGEYLMFNTPHKISLYIRCGLPVIVWRKAAMAGFIEENGIGICVDSLRDIDGIYERLTQEEYARMCDNVRRVSRLMAEGGYFSRALSRVLACIGSR